MSEVELTMDERRKLASKPMIEYVPKSVIAKLESAAELRGERKRYVQSLDDVQAIVDAEYTRCLSGDGGIVPDMDVLQCGLDQLKSDYLQEGEDGKTE